MENKIAKIISYFFHPIFLPVYCIFLLLNLKSYFSFEIVFNARLMLLSFVATTTIIFPLLIIYLMKRQGYIQSFQMKNLQERRYPYLITAIFYILTYNMFRQLQLPDIYILYMMGASFLLIIIVIINIWWKISTHMVGIGGVTGLAIGIAIKMGIDLMFPIIIITFIAGIIGFARLKLNSHKPSEIYAGFIVGVIVMTGIFYFL